MDVGGRKEDVDSCQVEYTSMVVFKDFVPANSWLLSWIKSYTYFE